MAKKNINPVENAVEANAPVNELVEIKAKMSELKAQVKAARANDYLTKAQRRLAEFERHLGWLRDNEGIDISEFEGRQLNPIAFTKNVKSDNSAAVTEI